MTDMFDVAGKVVMITGGSRGLGKAMSLEFGRRGAKVVVASRKIEECEKVVEDLRSQGAEALAVTSTQTATLFPEGSEGGKALPIIWEEPDKFAEAAKLMEETSRALA